MSDDKTLTESGQNVNMKGVSNRETRIFWICILLAVIVLVEGVGLSFLFVSEVMRPSNQVVIDTVTGEVVGQYRTTAFRTDDEIKGATKRFIGCEMSYNSDRIYEDHACGLSMMGKEMRIKRVKYLQETNLTNRIAELEDQTSRIERIETKVLDRRGNKVWVNTLGRIKMGGTYIPFQMDITWKQVPISTGNTAGVLMVERKEYKATAIIASEENSGKESE